MADIHIEWSAPIAEVFAARDSAPAGWSDRTLSGGGLTLDMDRPDGSGDLAAGGTLTVVVRTASSMLPVATTCRWTLEGVDVGGCQRSGDGGERSRTGTRRRGEG